MPDVTVEYLAIFRRTDSFCADAQAFVRLLHVNSDIAVAEGSVHFKKLKTCRFEISHGDLVEKRQRYFQLKFTWSGEPGLAINEFDSFTALLRVIRGLISDIGGEVETLQDGVSTYYAERAYPLIHEIENLMRRLIANFMLINVGIEWTSQALPKDVEEAIKAGKRRPSLDEEDKKGRDYLNVLQTLDFIHLGNILFDPYSTSSPSGILLALGGVNSLEDAVALQRFVPQSNWSRYFQNLIECEGSFLKNRWDRLYLLRCKVAHNASMLKRDFDEIVKLIGEIKPIMTQAIGRLPQVKVATDQIELVAESAARNTNAAIGDFLASWQHLEAVIANKVSGGNASKASFLAMSDVRRSNALPSNQRVQYQEARQIRNMLVHGPSQNVPIEVIHRASAIVQSITKRLQAGDFVQQLKLLEENRLNREIDEIIADSMQEITESEEFGGEMATTNASAFTVDEYHVNDIQFGDDDCKVMLSYSASGEQHEDKSNQGTTISGEAVAVIDCEGGVEYQEVTAVVEYDADDEEEEDDREYLDELDTDGTHR